MAAITSNYDNMTQRQIETQLKRANDALKKKKLKKIYNIEVNKHERLTKQLNRTEAAIQKNDAEYKQLIAKLKEVEKEEKRLSKTKKEIKYNLSKSAAWRCKIREIIPDFKGPQKICWVQIPSGDIMVIKNGKEMKIGEGVWSKDKNDYTILKLYDESDEESDEESPSDDFESKDENTRAFEAKTGWVLCGFQNGKSFFLNWDTYKTTWRRPKDPVPSITAVNPVLFDHASAEEFWKLWPKQKEQLIAWKNLKNEKSKLEMRQLTSIGSKLPAWPGRNALKSFPSIISKCKNESKLARLRQRIRARQATPKCWPQKTDTKAYIKMKEAYISYIVGGDWFNKKMNN